MQSRRRPPKRHQSTFQRGLLTVATGTMSAHVITLAAAPLLARIFSPQEYGVLGVFTTLAAMLGAISSLRLDIAIVAVANHARSKVFLSALASAAVSTLIVALGAGLVAALVSAELTADYQWPLALLPMATGLIGVFQVVSQFYAANHEFGPQSTGHVIRTGSGHASQLLAAVGTRTATGLIVGNVIGQLIASTYMVLRLLRRFPDTRNIRLEWTEYGEIVRRERAYILYGTPQALLDILNYSLPVFVLGIGFGSGVVGLYAMAQRLLSMPASIVGNALRQVMLPLLADAAARGTAYSAMRRSVALLAIIVSVIGVIAYGAAPYLFVWVLGDEWREAGKLAQYLLPWIAGELICIPIVAAVPLLELQRIHSVIEAVLFVFRALFMVGGMLLGSLEVAVLMPSVLSFGFAVLRTVVVLRRAWRVWR